MFRQWQSIEKGYTDLLGELTDLPLVSIVVPVYNVETYLSECLESIFAQTYKNLEIICADDGSTDSSVEILNHYANIDTRMVVLTQKNEGAAAARNKALSQVKGEFIAFVDSDDLIDPRLVETTVCHALKTSAEIVLFRFRELNAETCELSVNLNSLDTNLLPESSVFSGSEAANLFMATFPNVWTKLYKTSYLSDSNLLALPKLTFAEDLPFVYTVLAQAKRIALVDEALYCYRRRRSNSVSNSVRGDSDTIILSLLTFKRQLRERALLDCFQKTFNHRCVSTLWHELHTDQDPKRLAEELSSTGLQEIGLCGLSPDDFFDLVTFQHYLATLEYIDTLINGYTVAHEFKENADGRATSAFAADNAQGGLRTLKKRLKAVLRIKNKLD